LAASQGRQAARSFAAAWCPPSVRPGNAPGGRLARDDSDAYTNRGPGRAHFNFCHGSFGNRRQETSLKRTQKDPPSPQDSCAKIFDHVWRSRVRSRKFRRGLSPPHLISTMRLADLVRFAATILSNAIRMSQEHTNAIREPTWSPEKKLPLAFGCFGASPSISRAWEPLGRQILTASMFVHINSGPSTDLALCDRGWPASVKVQAPFALEYGLVAFCKARLKRWVLLLASLLFNEDLKSGALREMLTHFPIPVHPLSLVFSTGETNAAR